MDKKRVRQLKIGIALVAILGILWIAKSGVSSFMTPIVYVSEISEDSEEYLGKDVQLAGLVAKDSWREVKGKRNTYEFQLTDGRATVKVKYTGVLPGTLRDDIGITAMGTLVSPTEFKADKLLLKCPSKYEQSVRESLKQT